jgi:hypothetical protein
VGQNKEPLPPMWRPDFLRRKESCRNPVTHCDQISEDHVSPKPQMPRDVFTEDVLGLALSDNPGELRPEVSGIGVSESLAGDTERLARIPAMYDVNQSSPREAIESPKVIPDWGRVQYPVGHAAREDAPREVFDLDVRDRPVTGDGKV